MLVSTSQPAPVDFATVVPAVEKALFSRAMGLERSAEDAADLVQDTFERALRNLHQFRAGTNIRMWLFRIMYNLFVDCRRRRHSEARNDNIEPAELAAPDPDPLEPWEQIDHAKVTDVMNHLEPHYRDVLELHLVSHTYREIGATLGIPPGTVGTRLLRARDKLRGMLEPMSAANCSARRLRSPSGGPGTQERTTPTMHRSTLPPPLPPRATGGIRRRRSRCESRWGRGEARRRGRPSASRRRWRRSRRARPDRCGTRDRS